MQEEVPLYTYLIVHICVFHQNMCYSFPPFLLEKIVKKLRSFEVLLGAHYYEYYYYYPKKDTTTRSTTAASAAAVTAFDTITTSIASSSVSM